MNGNVLSYADSVNGSWSMGYDSLNRLVTAASGAVGPYQGFNLSMQYVAKADTQSNNLTCSLGGSASTSPSATYVVGQAGEQMTEFDGTGAWKHTNIFAGGQLLATYDTLGLHFPLSDALGTVRVQASAQGVREETFSSLPYGDGMVTNTITDSQDATEHHFTAKERDTESGLDYFGARYYASSMGRWMSPDWSAEEEPVPYAKLDNPQTLNLYGYMQNNPLGGVDQDGHCGSYTGCGCQDGQLCASTKANSPTPTTLPHTETTITVTAKGHWWNNVGSWFGGKTAAAGVAFARFGRLGGPAHTEAVGRISRLLEEEGYTVTPEKYIPTPNGAKNYRFADVYGKNETTGEVRMFQVGRTNANGTPVAREAQALNDIEGATEIRPEFVDYQSPLATGEFAPAALPDMPMSAPEDIPMEIP